MPTNRALQRIKVVNQGRLQDFDQGAPPHRKAVENLVSGDPSRV